MSNEPNYQSASIAPENDNQGGPKSAAPKRGQARAAQPPADEPELETSASASAEIREEQEMERTKRLLAAQPKRRIRIHHPNPKDKKEVNYETACINGLVFQVQKGVEVDVPETVHHLFVEGGII